MKKKLTALLLASAMVLSLAACGGDTGESSAPEGTSPAENTNPDATLTLKIGVSTNDEDPRNIAAQQFGIHLAGDGNQGNGIHIGRGKAGDKIGGARAGRGDTYAGFAAGTGVSAGLVGGVLFAAHQHMADLRLG